MQSFTRTDMRAISQTYFVQPEKPETIGQHVKDQNKASTSAENDGNSRFSSSWHRTVSSCQQAVNTRRMWFSYIVHRHAFSISQLCLDSGREGRNSVFTGRRIFTEARHATCMMISGPERGLNESYNALRSIKKNSTKQQLLHSAPIRAGRMHVDYVLSG